MTKSKGVGRGGVRAGAGRKPVVVDVPPEIAALTPDQVMEAAMHALLAKDNAAEASKAAARLAQARARVASSGAPGKKGAAQARAEEHVATGGRFAPAAPPKLN